MTTCRDIVYRALRQVRVIGLSDDPEAEELTNGMLILQSLYDQWLTGGMFGRLKDIYNDGDYEACEGQRIYLDSGTVTLPETIDDDRKPRDLVAIETHDPTNGRRAWIWDRIAWVRIDSLEPGDDAPLADRGMNGLAACVAQLYAEEFGETPTSNVARQAASFKQALSYKMGSTQNAVAGTYY